MKKKTLLLSRIVSGNCSWSAVPSFLAQTPQAAQLTPPSSRGSAPALVTRSNQHRCGTWPRRTSCWTKPEKQSEGSAVRSLPKHAYVQLQGHLVPQRSQPKFWTRVQRWRGNSEKWLCVEVPRRDKREWNPHQWSEVNRWRYGEFWKNQPITSSMTLIASPAFNPHPGHVVASLDKMLNDDYLSLVASNEQQILWTRIRRNPQERLETPEQEKILQKKRSS